MRVTPGAAQAGGDAEANPPQKIPASEISVAGAGLSITPAQGPVQTRAVLTGHGFPANASVSLIWGTQVGSRVSGNGFAPQEHQLATLTVAADGRLEAPVPIPDHLGGLHTRATRPRAKRLARAPFASDTIADRHYATSATGGTAGGATPNGRG